MDIITDNYYALNHSFLYYLHEKDNFNIDAFYKLINYIDFLPKKQDNITLQLMIIQNEILKHIIYHFDPKDISKITNLPDNYLEHLSTLELSIKKYFRK